VDLNSTATLSQRKLLILQEAKSTKTATRADLSFSFHSVFLDHNLYLKKIRVALNAPIVKHD
jgi:hypothetical protein